jgi:phosphoglycerate dehydrogenase-like enzyme
MPYSAYRGKILITPRSLTKKYHPAFDKLKEAGFELLFCKAGEQPAKEELLHLLPQCAGYLAGIEKIDKEVLEAAIQLKVISRNGVGFDNIDTKAAAQLNIQIATTPGANARSVAELAITLMFAAARNISFQDAQLKNLHWKRKEGFEVKDKTLGVIGCGAIGKEVSAMALALGMHVKAYDLYPDPGFQPSQFFHYASLEEVLQEADIVTLHCPPADKPVINNITLQLIKDESVLINTARADLIDMNEVYTALQLQKLSIYATDVFPQEPPLPHPLWQHEQVITAPHIGGYTKESINRATEMAVNNLLRHLL